MHRQTFLKEKSANIAPRSRNTKRSILVSGFVRTAITEIGFVTSSVDDIWHVLEQYVLLGDTVKVGDFDVDQQGLQHFESEFRTEIESGWIEIRKKQSGQILHLVFNGDAQFDATICDNEWSPNRRVHFEVAGKLTVNELWTFYINRIRIRCNALKMMRSVRCTADRPRIHIQSDNDMVCGLSTVSDGAVPRMPYVRALGLKRMGQVTIELGGELLVEQTENAPSYFPNMSEVVDFLRSPLRYLGDWWISNYLGLDGDSRYLCVEASGEGRFSDKAGFHPLDAIRITTGSSNSKEWRPLPRDEVNSKGSSTLFQISEDLKCFTSICRCADCCKTKNSYFL